MSYQEAVRHSQRAGWIDRKIIMRRDSRISRRVSPLLRGPDSTSECSLGYCPF